MEDKRSTKEYYLSGSKECPSLLNTINKRFKISTILDSGSSARVFLAYDLEREKHPVAVKIYKGQTLKLSRHMKQLMMHNETFLLKRCQHKNIQKYVDSGTDGEIIWDSGIHEKNLIYLVSDCPTSRSLIRFSNSECSLD